MSFTHAPSKPNPLTELLKPDATSKTLQRWMDIQKRVDAYLAKASFLSADRERIAWSTHLEYFKKVKLRPLIVRLAVRCEHLPDNLRPGTIKRSGDCVAACRSVGWRHNAHLREGGACALHFPYPRFTIAAAETKPYRLSQGLRFKCIEEHGIRVVRASNRGESSLWVALNTYALSWKQLKLLWIAKWHLDQGMAVPFLLAAHWG
eukprot:GHVU01232575.1.p1 GENE.GHVU01232575.1~~GHVU01232575.1.p1  ORF type:complete len:223 (-),score=6.03 GHVU01232575.1:123-737(-)